MSTVWSVIFAILMFSVLIFIHEFGHFIAAKLSGVQVNEFSMFMGPAIAKWQRGETQYSIRCIPIGGYCAMEGENEDTDNPRSFQKASWWKRLIILVAGSGMNFLIGVILIAVVLYNQPYFVTPQLSHVESWSTVGGETGLQVGDEIVKFDGKKIRIYEDFSLATMMLPDDEYDITVIRDGQKVELDDVPMYRQLVTDEDGTESMLYGFNFSIEEPTVKTVVENTVPTAMYYVRSVFVSLKMLFTGQAGVKDMAGPVGIIGMMVEVASQSEKTWIALLNLLSFAGFIAINLAVMNLLPIPALDGGRVVGLLLTTVIEAITRKKLNPKYESYIHAVGMVLLFVLMGLLVFKDIFTIFKG